MVLTFTTIERKVFWGSIYSLGTCGLGLTPHWIQVIDKYCVMKRRGDFGSCRLTQCRNKYAPHTTQDSSYTTYPAVEG